MKNSEHRDLFLLAVIVGFALLVNANCQDQKADSKTFKALAGYTITSTMLDSYTTSWSRENRQATFARSAAEHRMIAFGPCSREVGEPWLYGKEPTKARSFAVGAGKIGLALGSSWVLRRKHSKLWAVPMALISADSTMGFANNFEVCQ